MYIKVGEMTIFLSGTLSSQEIEGLVEENELPVYKGQSWLLLWAELVNQLTL